MMGKRTCDVSQTTKTDDTKVLICGKAINKGSEVLVCELFPVEVEVCEGLVVRKGITQSTEGLDRKTLLLVIRACGRSDRMRVGTVSMIEEVRRTHWGTLSIR